jgi:hypothetical protein
VSGKIEGGCACGAVRYRCDAEPVLALNCHCRDRQRMSGAAFVSGIIVPISAMTIEGEVRWFENEVEDGHRARRGFCPICGTQLFSDSSRHEFRGIRSASLDDPSWFAPAVDIFTRSAQPWVKMDPALTKFETVPTRG